MTVKVVAVWGEHPSAGPGLYCTGCWTEKGEMLVTEYEPTYDRETRTETCNLCDALIEVAEPDYEGAEDNDMPETEIVSELIEFDDYRQHSDDDCPECYEEHGGEGGGA